jgi:hypothetical protein
VAEVDTAGRAVRLTDGSPGSGHDHDHGSEHGHEHGSGYGDGESEEQPVIEIDAARHPFLRRWDQRPSSRREDLELRDGALVIEEGRWIGLEDGIEVFFAPDSDYRSGDAWIAPARTLDGDVDWPRDEEGAALLLPPRSPQVHLAPLAWVAADGQVTDLRRSFGPLAAFG